MILYNNTSTKLNQVKEKPFKLEKDIQNIFEKNLQELMGLELVKSEFAFNIQIYIILVFMIPF